MPCFGLLCIAFIRDAILSNQDVLANAEYKPPVPFLVNFPLQPVTKLLDSFVNVQDCQEWYMYQFDANVSASDREYFGHNEGSSVIGNSFVKQDKNSSSGMLKGGKNIMEIPCASVNKTVPFFKELKKGSQNQEMYDIVNRLSDQHLELELRGQDVDGLDQVPDGMLKIAESNKNKFRYKLQINDYRYYQYHRNNGISKLGIIMDSKDRS